MHCHHCSDSRLWQDVRELQLAYDVGIASFYVPALKAVENQFQPSKEIPETDFDLFDGYTDSGLRELYTERQQELGNWVEEDLFVVLDSYGADTKTVVLHNHMPLFDDTSEEEIGRRWLTWRVLFADVGRMIAMLLTEPDIVDLAFMDPENFTGEDGIFRLKEAYRSKGVLP